MSASKQAPPDDAVWFITGCSSGIGAALASYISSHPTHRLVATARKGSSVLSFLPSSPNTLKLALDVTSSASIGAAIAATVAHFGRIDVLVNNAGYAAYGDAEAFGEEERRRQVETLFWGAANLSIEGVRIMREMNTENGTRPPGGVIVQITSLGGRMGVQGHAYYHAGKFALEGFTESISKEMHPDWNISFLILEPGGVKTDFATRGMVFLPSHPAYTAPACPTNQLREYMKSPDSSNTWSQPDDLAKVMFQTIMDPKRPFRLPMGADAWGMLSALDAARRSEMEDWKNISFECAGENAEAQLKML